MRTTKNNLDIQIGRVYKICKGGKVSADVYIFITGKEEIHGLIIGNGNLGTDIKITFNYVRDIGKKAYIYLSELISGYDVELHS